MPVYEYRCQGCGAPAEHLLPRHSDPDPPCAACGGELERQVSTFGTSSSIETVGAGPGPAHPHGEHGHGHGHSHGHSHGHAHPHPHPH